MTQINVVGVDPSLRNFGIVKAVLDVETMKIVSIKEMLLVESESNTKKQKTVRKNSDDLRRARLLHEGFVEACKDASFAFVEVPVGSQSARSMASYGICVGVLAACPVPLIQVTPAEVKLAMTGIKTATKEEMIEAAVAEFPGAPWLSRKLKGERVLLNDNEHLADAVGALKAGIKTDEFKGAAAFLKAAIAA